MIKKTADELRDLVVRIAEAVGTPPDCAAILADVLVGSHLAGHDSHGIQHLPRYIREVHAGDIVPDARPQIESETDSTALVRGNWAWGHVTADFFTELGIEKAKKNKIALVGVVEVNHIGRLGEYVERAASEGVVTILTLGVKEPEMPVAAPYGGRKGLLAPNPIAMGFPVHGSHPVVLDFATTQIAGGKVMLAKAKGVDLAPGCILNKNGAPSTDPNDYFDGGALLPFGGHKGSAVMIATEILGQILSGTDAYTDTPHGGPNFRHAGMTLISIDSGVFSSTDDFAARTGVLVDRIHAVPPADGFDEVQAPGDFEQQIRDIRTNEGIEIPESTWNELFQTAEEVGAEI